MEIIKRVQFNRETHDHDMFLNGEYVGSRATPQEAREELDRLAFLLLSHSS
jgi:hypothetical protein